MKIQILDRLERKLHSTELLDELGQMGTELVRKNIKRGPWKANAPLTQRVKGGDKPLQDSGRLLSAVDHKTENGSAIIGVAHPAAKILHDGGTIRPKRAKYLAIPLGAHTRRFMRKHGTTPRKCIQGLKQAGYSVWVQKNVILGKKGKRGKTWPLFVLKSSVKISARPFLKLPPESVLVLERTVQKRIFS